jgi:uroporphyrinogen-III decarboxylase
MEGNKGGSFFSAESVGTLALDPKDPKTWCIAENQHNPDWIQVSAQMHDHAMTLAGVPACRFYGDANAHVNVMVAVAAYYRFDTGRGSFDVYNIEAEAMGQKMIRSNSAMPTVDFREPLIEDPADLLRIPVPDWHNAGRASFALDVIKLNASLGLNRGYFCAPFSLAVALRSYPRLIKDMKKNPGFAHDIFAFLVDEILPSYLKTQKDSCAVTVGLGSDAWAAFPNLSPALLEEWVVPYTERLSANLGKFGASALYVGGADYCEERLENFDKGILFKCMDTQVKFAGGAPIMFMGMGRWQDYPLESMVEYLQPYKEKGIRAIMTAGVNARLLRNGPIESIVDYIRRVVDAIGRDHDLSFWLANIPADTPPEHVHATVAAVHAYGLRPIPKNLDDVKVHVHLRESFQEYVDTVSDGAGIGI